MTFIVSLTLRMQFVSGPYPSTIGSTQVAMQCPTLRCLSAGYFRPSARGNLWQQGLRSKREACKTWTTFLSVCFRDYECRRVHARQVGHDRDVRNDPYGMDEVHPLPLIQKYILQRAVCSTKQEVCSRHCRSQNRKRLDSTSQYSTFPLAFWQVPFYNKRMASLYRY